MIESVDFGRGVFDDARHGGARIGRSQPATDAASGRWQPRMLARRRRELIAAHVQRHGSARVSDLTTQLGVSDMTIRRDLDLLTREGLVNKVHGGATLPSATTVEPGFTVKSTEQIDEKRAIALAAAAMVRPGTAIGLTAGTTTWRLVEALAPIADLMVVTNSIRICEALLADRARATSRCCSPAACARRPTPSSARSPWRRWRRCISTRCSWACTACRSAPASPRRTCSRPRPTRRSWRRRTAHRARRPHQVEHRRAGQHRPAGERRHRGQ